MIKDLLMEFDAERTRNLMPNYNLVNKRLKQLRVTVKVNVKKTTIYTVIFCNFPESR